MTGYHSLSGNSHPGHHHIPVCTPLLFPVQPSICPWGQMLRAGDPHLLSPLGYFPLGTARNQKSAQPSHTSASSWKFLFLPSPEQPLGSWGNSPELPTNVSGSRRPLGGAWCRKPSETVPLSTDQFFILKDGNWQRVDQCRPAPCANSVQREGRSAPLQVWPRAATCDPDGDLSFPSDKWGL